MTTQPKPHWAAKDGTVEIVAEVTRAQKQRVTVRLEQGASWDDYLEAVNAATEDDKWDTSPTLIRHVAPLPPATPSVNPPSRPKAIGGAANLGPDE